MKEDFESHLGASRPKAVMQFKQLEKRMEKNQFLSESYKKIIHEYQQFNHMRPADHVTSIPTCYLAHHGVTKIDFTTTSLRVVFNASAKTSSGHSLNDLMECGLNLQQDLQGLILKWRTLKYVITADIEKIYRQILIREKDSYLQTIIWRDSPEDLLREYRLTTVTYGTKPAPFLAMRTLKEIANNKAIQFPLAAKAIESEFYMDDLMSGHDNILQAKELQKQLIYVLKDAGMNLRKWSSNEPELIKDLSANQLNSPFEFKDAESRKTLGLQWNPSSDTFNFQNKIDYYHNSTTKRQLLSDISNIYDPLGWLSPVIIKAKILFQRTWIREIKWDDELPAEILHDWNNLREDLKNIEHFHIDRYLGDRKSYQLHGFSDASNKAYACSVYVTTCNDKGEYTSRLIAAKTKLAPHNKQISLPMLELLGAALLSQLLKKVADSISENSITIYAWTDSMVVLGWLHGDISRWKQFVANRVRQIIDIVPASQWRHVKSDDNAADCATRGMTTNTLKQHQLWWEGPQWIKTSNPNETPTTKIEIPNIEVKKHHVHTALQSVENSIITQLIKHTSSLTRAVRIFGWLSRFITRLRNKQSASQNENILTTIELYAALNLIIKHTQQREFEEDFHHLKKKGHVRSSSKISNLHPFIDDHGILRVCGRLNNAPISYFAKHPVIFSSGNRLTELIINQAHISTLHGGPRLTLSFIRNNYWIISGTRTVKKIIGLKKEYKAILQTIDTTFIKNINEMGVTSHFNAPAWPSAGGLWEAAVKSMKFHLKCVIGDQKLTYQEFTTLLYQIEACMNSRPLCALTENHQDDCLTPGHFLVGDSLLSRPQTDSDVIELPARWHLVQSMNKHFWKRWSHEYLQQLQTRTKWRTPTKNLEVNDIVIIKEDNLPPVKWALGRVEHVHSGKDGYVRVVSLKTRNKIIKRPISKLIILPVDDVSQQATADRVQAQSTSNTEPERPKRNLRPRQK